MSDETAPSARVLAIAGLLDMLIEREVAEIRREYEGTDREKARIMYRRGYHVGHAAGRRGAPEVTNPERRARGTLREILEAPDER